VGRVGEYKSVVRHNNDPEPYKRKESLNSTRLRHGA
jgi:hypothetical protein